MNQNNNIIYSNNLYVNTLLNFIHNNITLENKNNIILAPFIMPYEDIILKIREKRQLGNYKPILFISVFNQDIPNILKKENIQNLYLKSLLDKQKFGEIDKAVLYSELIIDNNEILNFISISLGEKFFKILLEKIEKVIDFFKNTKLNLEYVKKSYYKIFVEYYNEIEKFKYLKNLKEKVENKNLVSILNISDNLEINRIFEIAEGIYRYLNGFEVAKKRGSHFTPLELFQAPIPFLLCEIIEAYKNLENSIKNNNQIQKKIKLLLIDNKIDKIFEKNENNSYTGYCGKLIECFINFNLFKLFDLIILGINKENLVITENKIIKNENNKYKFKNIDNSFLKEDLYFDFRKFKIDEDYKKFIYDKIKNTDFILLDFFLDSDNIYLAFDFIKDINDIKKQNNDYSTTWYFITSAVYDSVIKYSQSGLLAEHYETAVVNSGDDPTNEKRQIIFLYKLLTFINARLKNFENIRNAIIDWCKEKDCENICNTEKPCNNKKCENFTSCKNYILTVVKKYLFEYPDIIKIFPAFKDENLYEIVHTLESIIHQFEWLPEADWQIIQHQIEYVNNLFDKVENKENDCKYGFYCKYINDEIKRRSEEY